MFIINTQTILKNFTHILKAIEIVTLNYDINCFFFGGGGGVRRKHNRFEFWRAH